VLMQVMRDRTTDIKAGEGSADPAARSAKKNSASTPNKAVARVGGTIISEDDLARECIMVSGKKVLDDMINRLVILKACEEKGIEVTDDEVDKEILKISKQFNLPIDSWYQMLEAEQGISRQKYRRDVIWPMLALRKLAGEQTEISEDDVRKAFARDYGERVKARIIVLDNLRRAQTVWEEANKGTPEDFERLAANHSIEPTSRSLRGAIPPIRRYVGNDELEKVAFKLKEGEISGVVQLATSRYAIILCEGRTEPVVENIDEVRDTIIANLVEEKSHAAVNDVFEKLMKETRVDNFLTNTSNGGEESANEEPAGTAKIRPTSATQKTSTGGEKKPRAKPAVQKSKPAAE
ncbi:MAG: SurA N-terminal domain-containing protein, partial [Planctomycetaceae bacterium]